MNRITCPKSYVIQRFHCIRVNRAQKGRFKQLLLTAEGHRCTPQPIPIVATTIRHHNHVTQETIVISKRSTTKGESSLLLPLNKNATNNINASTTTHLSPVHVAGSHGAVVGSLRAGEGVLGPAKRVLIHVQESVLLLKAKHGDLLLYPGHHLVRGEG